MAERVQLCGDTVRLDPMVPDDVEGLLAAATEDRSTYGFTSVPRDAGAMVAYVQAALDDEGKGVALPFAIRLIDGDRVVGSTRFLDLDYWTGDQDTPSVVEIGSTWLAASVQRSRVNTECKLLLLTCAFDVWSAARVTFKTDARNQRSRDAIARLGATFEGIRRAHMPATDGTIRDSAYFSMLRSEWPACRRALRARLDAGDS